MSWGDLRNDMVPPGAGCKFNEERTSPRVRLFILVGYHNGGALSRDNMFTGVAQGFFN